MDKTERLNFSIFGYQPSSFSDYPGRTAAVFFASGCNMKCSYCHNLKTMEEAGPLDEDKLKSCLDHAMANNISDAVVISGGEPTLQPEGLKKFIGEIKKRSKKLVKLDTNGTNPDLLKELLKDKLVDFVAMDIKGHFESYDKFSFKGGSEKLYESVNAILKSGIDHEFRCTVADGFEKKDLAFIKKNFPDIKLQKYRERK